ncbi:MAG: hypothetical protein MJY99_02150 [Fibrobacter sp.]|nr:hypothetical protein [Fibrobacter sp.]
MKLSVKTMTTASVSMLSATIAFVACSGDVTKVTDEYISGATLITKKDKLPDCDELNSGEIVYVTENGLSYICANEKWHVMSGANGENGKDGEDGKAGAQGVAGEPGEKGASCTMKAIENDESLAGIEVTCGANVDTLWSGVDGENGIDGTDGYDGVAGSIASKCGLTKVANEDSSRFGVEIACKNAKPDTLWNGLDGQDGAPGDQGLTGDGCTSKKLVDAKDSVWAIEISCGSGDLLTRDTIVNGVDGSDGDVGAVLASCELAKVVDNDGRKGIEMTCSNSDPDTLWSGVDGMNGNPGTDGNKCSSTSVVGENGIKGVEITCGTESTTLWSGKDGENGGDGGDGADGDNGVGCVAADDGFGLIHITCGSGTSASSFDIYKGLCEGKPYDPDHFDCIDGKAIGKGFVTCGEEYYNPETSECLDASISLFALKGWKQCGTAAYDPEVDSCYFSTTIDVRGLSVCGTSLYDPAKKACYFGTTVGDIGLAECGTELYDAETQECYDETNSIVGDKGQTLCGVVLYDATKKECYFGNTVADIGLSICGTALYDETAQECYDETNSIVGDIGLALCGTELYDSAEDSCYNAATSLVGEKGQTLCGGVLVGAEGTCINGAVYTQGSLEDNRGSTTVTYKTMTVTTSTTTQTWMADNLNYATSSGSMCGGSNKDCSTYGRLYNWSAANSACPSGWHLPTTTEWNNLICTLDKNCTNSASNYGKAVSVTGRNSSYINSIRTPDMWTELTQNGYNGTNTTGFSTIPAGFGTDANGTAQYTQWNIFWTATSCGNNSVGCHVQLTDTEFKVTNEQLGDYYLTVRCLKDAE